MGVFFAAGWSPCIGATLGAILTLGLSQDTAGQAMWLSSGYSIGLGISFLLLALGLERASGWVNRVKRYQRWFKIASGVFILIIGVMLLTNTMNRIAIWAFQHGYFIDAFTEYAAAPTYLTAIWRDCFRSCPRACCRWFRLISAISAGRLYKRISRVL